jgi:hypothetical protein
MSLDPGYVFFPTDIQYFIDFERRDRARREEFARDTGTSISSFIRQVPTSDDYKQHQVNNNIISPTAIGGRYSRLFLKQYLHGGELPGAEAFFSTAKEWHGAPLASFRRAFAALASPRFLVIVDVDTRHMLEELQQLYFSDDCLSPEQVSLRDVYRPQAQTSQKRQLEDQTNDKSGRYEKKAKCQDTGFARTPAGVNQCQDDESGRHDKKARCQDVGFAGTLMGSKQCRGYTDWVLGPETTSNDAIKLYAPVFSST